MIFTFLRSNSGFIFAMYPSSVVQTGVKSFGCENRTAHESPIQSWKLIRPSVLSASKSGAVSPSLNAIGSLLSEVCARDLPKFLSEFRRIRTSARWRPDIPLGQGEYQPRGDASCCV